MNFNLVRYFALGIKYNVSYSQCNGNDLFLLTFTTLM